MDNFSVEVASKMAIIVIEADGFRIYGNKASLLGTDTLGVNGEIYLYPKADSELFYAKYRYFNSGILFLQLSTGKKLQCKSDYRKSISNK